MNLSSWREVYDKDHLTEDKAAKEPFSQFDLWFQQAIKDQNYEPNAMVLSTSENNMPNSRVVLLKSYEHHQFEFYTNYNSQKGKEIDANPNVMLLFYWNQSQRQVRIKGTISKLDREQSIRYFDSRPEDSKISAMASPQSQPISLHDLKQNVEKVAKESDMKCPEDWGGYSVHPSYFEFWQGQPGRLHDRLVYEKKIK